MFYLIGNPITNAKFSCWQNQLIWQEKQKNTVNKRIIDNLFDISITFGVITFKHHIYKAHTKKSLVVHLQSINWTKGKRVGNVFFSLILLLFLTVKWLKGNKVRNYISHGHSYSHTVTHAVTDWYLSLLSGGALLTSKHAFSQNKALYRTAGIWSVCILLLTSSQGINSKGTLYCI